MASSLDMTICRRCGEPMAAVISGGALPRYLCRLCGDLDFPAAPSTVRPAPRADLPQFFVGPVKQVGLRLGVVVSCGIAATGRQPLHEPAARYSDQFPLHATELPQLDCA
jgi:hypothetical protein